MTTLRLRYKNGYLIPLAPLPDLKDGDEIEVEWQLVSESADLTTVLERTRGLWADWEGIEQLIDDARE